MAKYATERGTYESKPGKTPVYTPARPDTSRNQNLAGQTVYDNGYNSSYNEDGYHSSSAHVEKTGQTRADYSKDAVLDSSGRDQNKVGDANYTTNEEYNVLKQYGDMWTEAYNNNDQEGMRKAHELAEQFREQLGYSGGADGSRFIVGGKGGVDQTHKYTGGGSTGTGYQAIDPYGVDHRYAIEHPMSAEDLAQLQAAGEAYNNATTQAERDAAHAQAEAIRAKYGYSGGVDGSQYLKFPNSGYGTGSGSGSGSGRIGRLDNTAPDLGGLLNQWLEAAKQQQNLQTDYAVNQGILELQRAEEDAQQQFQTQQNQVDEDEAKALDNQALYAEARGDRGGIGQAQYAQIQATAMTNRRAINSARTKLATDTARQIADLRAQGEFQKADALLELTQTYLSQLMDLEKWGAEFNLDVDKFNLQLDQWEAEFNMAVGEMLGTYQGQATLENQKYQTSVDQWNQEFNYGVQQNEREFLANSGLAALSVGIRPSAAQQAAMGYTDAQVDAELAAYKLAQAAGVKGSGGGGNPPKAPEPTISEMLKTFETEAEARAYLLDQKVSEQRYEEYMMLFYEYQEEKQNQPSAAMQEQERLQGLYGTSFTQALAWANTMLSKGVSDADIEAKLKQFSSSSLNEEGLRTIMQFIAEKRAGLGV